MNFDFPTILVLATLISGGIWLIDTLLFASRRRQVSIGKTREPILVEYSRSFFPVFLIVLLLRTCLMEPFRIPSGSMMPTLLIGDFILVNKFAYGIRVPITHAKVLDVGYPERGDVAVFRFPKEPVVDYIKRIVALPGDRVSYRSKTLYINGEAATITSIGKYRGVGAGIQMTGALEGTEKIGEHEHGILTNQRAPNFPLGCAFLQEQGEIIVPENHYFVMGDNRDNSNDSRCWGFVPDRNLVGKAFGIWMNWDSELPDFPINWKRLGSGIN